MDDGQEETISPIIIDGFTNTLLPVFSWFLSRLFSGILGCKLTVVLLHPTAAYRDRVADTWVKNNQLFSCAEVLKMSFQTASGRRRCRKKLKKLLTPFFREMNRSPECLLFKHRFQEKWNRLADTVNGIPPEIPRKVIYDIGEIEKRMDKEFSSYSSEDILDTFPPGETIKPRLVSRVVSEVGDYGQTVQSLWWEASRNWNLIRQIGIKKNSRIWAILGIHPDDEPDVEGLIDMALDFALGTVNEDKLTRLARWLMGRILVSQFLEQPYSEKQVISLETPAGKNLTLGHLLPDQKASDQLATIEERAVLVSSLDLLPASQREDTVFLLLADTLGIKSHELRRELGDKKYKAKQRNFERALKRLTDLRESGILPT